MPVFTIEHTSTRAQRGRNNRARSAHLRRLPEKEVFVMTPAEMVELWKERQRRKGLTDEEIAENFRTVTNYTLDTIPGGRLMAVGPAGQRAMASGGIIVTAVVSPAVRTFQWIFDDEVTWRHLLVNVSMDMAKAVAAAGAMVVVGTATAAATSIVIFPIIAGFIAAVVVGYSLSVLDSHLGINEALVDASERAQQELGSVRQQINYYLGSTRGQMEFIQRLSGGAVVNRVPIIQRAGPGKGTYLLIALGMLLFGLASSSVMAWLLVAELGAYSSAMESLAPLLVWSSGNGILFVFPLVGLVFLLLAVLALRRALDVDKQLLKAASSLEKVSAVIALITLGALFFAGLGGRFYWDHSLREAGYERCPNSFFLTSRWLTSVWVQDLAYCRDPEVRSLMASPRHGIDDINEYLREQER